MDPRFQETAATALREMREQGLLREEWPILGPQGPEIRVEGRAGTVLNFCANNYLGLSGHPELLAAAHRTLDEWGYGMSSVRFICGTQKLHEELEAKVAEFLGMESAILYAACFDANGGVFEPLLGAEDAILTDRLTITGPGSSLLTIRRAAVANFRVLYANVTALNLSGLTISSGDTLGAGGGILISGISPIVDFNDMTFANNKAVEIGGAVAMYHDTFLSVRNSTISGNTSGDSGGGICFYSGGNLLLENSTISGNAASVEENGNGGGGIYFGGPVGIGDDFGKLGMQAEREDQHVGAEFFQRHDGLFIVVGLRDHAHFIFHRQHLGGAGAEDSLVIGQNQFQHTRVLVGRAQSPAAAGSLARPFLVAYSARLKSCPDTCIVQKKPKTISCAQIRNYRSRRPRHSGGPIFLCCACCRRRAPRVPGSESQRLSWRR